ncbi:hypothetical protein FHS18_002229 [Paenibacillus phyllosphaerae]|uniref:Uncharacterized protein n=1 Tax=Paenibacillus phyllosphaerae TaxID=274593 RepID=A0A7W5AX19_9BACL|nr:hypothetical protein [Paenibacillus phyllosphaerae]MBB3110162.1 hypothetical protein [Paenibacillus phyllosphaerae]
MKKTLDIRTIVEQMNLTTVNVEQFVEKSQDLPAAEQDLEGEEPEPDASPLFRSIRLVG